MKMKLLSLIGLLAISTGSGHANEIEPSKMNGKLKVTTLSPEEIRYTGKPYSKELGAYVFNYRNFDPEMSRWTSADPSGFPDGANSQIYAPIPINQLDSKGLTTVTVTGVPTSGASGSTLSITTDSQAQQVDSNIQAAMQIHYSVSGTASGWVVQKVTIASNISNNDGSPYSGDTLNITYWEAWTVTNGSVQYGGQDNYNTPSFSTSTHGSVVFTGIADFYRTSSISSGAPSTWLAGGVAPAGVLLSTTTAPSWWGNSGFNHNMSLSWTE